MPDPKTASPIRATKSRATSTKRTAATKRPAQAERAAATARRTASASAQSRSAHPAERLVLVPLGAALIARERVISRVNDAIDHYSSPSKASAQLRRFERRGTSARKQLEREVRKTRVRVERELRHNRTRLERELRRRRRDGEELADRARDRVSSLL